jgi:para-nitrobenzyl esterase
MSSKKSDSNFDSTLYEPVRRSFLKQASMLIAGAQAGAILPFVSFGSAPASIQNGKGSDRFAVAETAYGKVRGRDVEGIKVFKSIPYGGSTTGSNRFRPPTNPQPWTGVREALDYGPSAPQRNPLDPEAGARSATVPLIGNLSGLPESEDCLVLNVWTPALKDGGKRPVMFWCHGGGFATGSGSSPGYDGTNLCRRGEVVVVTINHRLNVLGYTHLGDLGGEEFAESGNAGMLDIVHALKWVRDNISQFGGDPNTVLIFGESGGGRKVTTLLAMPAAKGLFHRAVIQSGPGIWMVGREQANKTSEMLLAELGINKAQVRDLQTLPLDRIMSAYHAVTRRLGGSGIARGFAPVVDGRVLPHHPFDPVAPAVSAGVPVIVGSNRTEMTLFAVGDPSAFTLDEAGLKQRAGRIVGKDAAQVIETYRKANPEATPSELYFLIFSDFRYGVPSIKLAERKAALGKAPVYLYRFAWETPVMGGKLKSPHALEIPFVFDNAKVSARLTGGGPDAVRLAAKVSEAWIAFARTGNPNTQKSGLPKWPAYDAKSRSTMIFNNESKVVNDPSRDERLVLDSIINPA